MLDFSGHKAFNDYNAKLQQLRELPAVRDRGIWCAVFVQDERAAGQLKGSGGCDD